MADISIQFHALPEEIARFLTEIAQEYSLYLVAITERPFKARQCVADELLIQAEKGLLPKKIFLSIPKPTIASSSKEEFTSNNPSCLLINAGNIDRDGLHESWLAIRSEDDSAMITWKKVAKKLIAMTKSGAVAVNPKTGATSTLRSHRYTDGAKHISENGVVILPVAGSSQLRLGV